MGIYAKSIRGQRNIRKATITYFFPLTDSFLKIRSVLEHL